MKVCLLNPTYYTSRSIGLSYGEPLGIAYIAASILKNSHHNVSIVDSVGLTTEFRMVKGIMRIGLADDEVIDLILKTNCDVLGISLIGSMYASEILEFIGKFKKIRPDILIIVGGPHATFEHKDVMDKAPVDIIVYGEGEGTIVELLDFIEEGKDIGSVKGIIYRDETGLVKTDARDPEPVESIPWPARHLLPMQNYLKNKAYHYFLQKPQATIITSRACPYNCIFCSTTLFWKRKYRARNPVDVVDEIEFLKNEYGVMEIGINDDCFLGNSKRVEQLCDELINRNLGITYQVQPGVNLSLLDENLLIKLKQSGLYIISPQIESGNPKTVKYIRKNIDLEKGKKIMKKANQLGMWTQTNIIIGFPDETLDDIKTSIRYAEKLQVDQVNYILPILFPHTDLHNDYLNKKLIDENFSYNQSSNSRYLKVEAIDKIRQGAQFKYNFIRLFQILNPFYFFTDFFPKINTKKKFMFFTKRVFFQIFNILLGRTI
jgi:magnesium-protoporphyrin IX monomethyl ester (oxidative) cyclase